MFRLLIASVKDKQGHKVKGQTFLREDNVHVSTEPEGDTYSNVVFVLVCFYLKIKRKITN